jgi:hypothetical protein
MSLAESRLHRVMAVPPAERFHEPLSQLPPPAFLRIYLTSHGRAMLKALSERTGASISAIISRALDQHLRRELSRLTRVQSICEETCHE